MNALHDKLADAGVQKKQLADGQLVSVAINVAPTANWGCKKIGVSPAYNWAEIQTQGAFRLSGDVGLLTDKALEYANQQNLRANYINLQIPDGKTLTMAYGKFSSASNLAPQNQAFAFYYQCARINPEHKFSVQKSTDVGFSVDD
jgi:hypothetical protein